MFVVGGVYQERCSLPSWETTQGSGLRAAAAVRAVQPDVGLLTAVDDELRCEFELVANAAGVTRRDTVERSSAVGFDYFTPLSVPSIRGTQSRVNRALTSHDEEDVLVFGMLEQPRRDIRCRRMVLDPQQPRSDLQLDRKGLQAAEGTVLIMNSTEARRFGGSRDVRQAGASLLGMEGIAAVVIKRGAAGCLVVDHGSTDPRISQIGACPTDRVWPLGSGDTFGAGFAQAWFSGADPIQAAAVGSRAAASWCSTQLMSVPPDVLAGTDGRYLEHRPQSDRHARIYLAAPFFTLGERWLLELVRDTLIDQGLEVFSPFHDVGPGDLSVAQADIDGLDQCTAVLALLDHDDPGTVFETGWAIRAGIPVIGYATTQDREGAKMLLGLDGELHDDLATAVYRAAWHAIGAL